MGKGKLGRSNQWKKRFFVLSRTKLLCYQTQVAPGDTTAPLSTVKLKVMRTLILLRLICLFYRKQ